MLFVFSSKMLKFQTDILPLAQNGYNFNKN